MNKSQVKILSFITLIFLVFLVVIFLYSSKEKTENSFYDGSIIIDGYKYLSYESKKWQSESLEDFSYNEKFKVYSVSEFIGDYIIKEANHKYYFFDKDYNSHNINSPFLAISNESNLSMVSGVVSSLLDVEDDNVINKYLKSINIDYVGDYSIKEKYIFLNDDNVENSVYIISNQLYSDSVFYLIFAKYGNKLITINNQMNVDDIIHYKLLWVLNSNVDGYNDLILGDVIMESYNYYFYSYNSKDKEYNKLF
jgi:hypothetical protein